MRIAATISRYLLGFVFLVFGLNGFFHFIPQPPPTGRPLQFFIAVSASHFIAAVFAVQTLSGALLLLNRYVPLAVTLLSGSAVQHPGLPHYRHARWAGIAPVRNGALADCRSERS